MKHHKTIDSISAVLLLIGGLCIGLVGAFDFEPISAIFGGGDMMAPLTRVIYVLIGLSAVYRLLMLVKAKSR
jgi:uncharacterized membrane protein YuzA (DUF378 family)